MSTENNKLIAGFMGMKYSDERSFNDGEWTHSVKSLSKFETSWDWLMPVVIKVGGNANLLGAMRNLRPYGVLRTIEDTHQAVVEFIKIHNLNVSSDNYSLVLATILKRCGSLDNLICELREDADVVYVNIADDIDDVLNEDEVEEIINKIITQEYELR
jgi:hypothetical protein